MEKLTLAIAKAVESASDDTLADIVGSHDLRHALVVAPRDIAPESPADLEALKAARERTGKFREEMAQRAGGMFDRAHVAEMLGVSYGTETRYPAAQFANGQVLHGIKAVLEAFDDMNAWEQLMMLTTPLEGFGSKPETVFETLARRPEPQVLKQLAGLAASWAA